MSYLLKKLAILASLLIVAGCGMNRYVTHTNVAEYPYRYADFDYKYAWKTANTDQGVVIDGIMKNVRYAYIDSLLVTVNVLGSDGKIVARGGDFPMPQQSREGEVSHFSLLLRDIKPASGDTFQFVVHYKGNEGGDKSGVDWISSFKADALTNAVIRTQNRNSDEW